MVVKMRIHLQREAKTFILVVLSFHTAMCLDTEGALLRLKQSFHNDTILSSWDPSEPPCFGSKSNWVGIVCSRGGNVYALRLENMGLSGRIDMDALSGLPKLRSISLTENEFGGPMPGIWRLRALKSVYLSRNRFEGPISPNAFHGLNRLERLHLAGNRLGGGIPPSLARLPKLVQLRLEDNRFQGPIPDFRTASLRDLSLANNQLEGPIPATFSGAPAHAFAGNKGLCGVPLEPCFPPTSQAASPVPSPSAPPKRKLVSVIPVIVAASVVILVALVAIAVRKRKPKTDKRPHPAGRDLEGAQSRPKPNAAKLCFMRDGGERFDLPDLLKSSAEILGSGCFGASYKASLQGSATATCTMVVKRFKRMNNVDRHDFEDHMRRLGSLHHPNLLPLVAYHYRKEEKLLVSNYVSKGSLALHLHGNQRGQLTLDWATRLKVIKGVARGLSYLHKQLPGLISPHGHLKSSNVLLDESLDPCLNDYGLTPLMDQDKAHQLMVAYKSPEYLKHGRINKKTDVWSLGILILEIITGELPTDHYLQHPADLSAWVQGLVGDGVGAHLLDNNMGSTRSSHRQILNMLTIGLACCHPNVQARWDINQASHSIQQVRELDSPFHPQ